MAGRTVSTRIITAQLLIPWAAFGDTFNSVAVDLGSVVLDAVTLVIPRGHAGTTGVAVEYAFQRIVPFSPSEWVTGDGVELTFPVGIEVGAPVTLTGFNGGSVDHSFYGRFQVSDLPAQRGSGLVQVLSL